MALTNFAALQPEQKIVWSKDVWQEAEDQSFVASKLAGKGDNAVIHQITELTQTEKGTRCIIPLVADLVKDGIIGDNEREGNEEEIMAYFEDIEVDLISHSVGSKGKLADQKSVIKFREWARSRLATWLANRIDQLAILTASGIGYEFNCDGSLRDPASPFPNLAFAAHVSPPSANRHVNWNGTTLEQGDTTVITNAYLPNYRMIVDLVTYAKDHYVKPLGANGREYYVLLVKPGTLAALKKDDDYQRAVVTGMPRDKQNPWFTGATITIDGAVIHEHRLVYSTQKAAAGSKWGAAGNVNGTRTLLCGAQALGMATIGDPSWVEKKFQYDSRGGINVDRMFGMVKPKFMSAYDKSVEDFGIVACDHYLQ